MSDDDLAFCAEMAHTDITADLDPATAKPYRHIDADGLLVTLTLSNELSRRYPELASDTRRQIMAWLAETGNMLCVHSGRSPVWWVRRQWNPDPPKLGYGPPRPKPPAELMPAAARPARRAKPKATSPKATARPKAAKAAAKGPRPAGEAAEGLRHLRETFAALMPAVEASLSETEQLREQVKRLSAQLAAIRSAAAPT